MFTELFFDMLSSQVLGMKQLPTPEGERTLQVVSATAACYTKLKHLLPTTAGQKYTSSSLTIINVSYCHHR